MGLRPLAPRRHKNFTFTIRIKKAGLGLQHLDLIYLHRIFIAIGIVVRAMIESHAVHPGWLDLAQRVSRTRLTRRQFVPRAAAAGLALSQLLQPGSGRVLAAAAGAATPDLANWPSNNKIKHVVILCQENRSFDHYFGAFASTLGKPGNRALGFEPAA